MLRFLRVLTLFLVSFLSFDVASWATTSSGFYCDASKTYVECDAGYYLSDCGSYRDGRKITRPAAGNSCKACPSANSSAYYECSGGAVCPKNMVENEFSISINVPKTGTVFGFNMSASGVFYVNWGDGRAIQKIDRTGLTANTGYPHTYTSTGTKTITISGQATAYNDSSHSMPAINFYYGSDDTAKLVNTSMIRSVSGSLGSVFGTLSTGENPRFNQLFTGAVYLTSVPSTLFSGITGFASSGMFTAAFMNTGLTSIPDGLFAGISGDIKPYTFSSTFNGCRRLTSIPENLFGNISGSMQSYAFHQMFNGCAALTGRSAKINGQYVYDIWRSATAEQVGEMYANATRLLDYPCIPTNYGGTGSGVCVDIVYDANGGIGNPPTSPLVCVYGQPCPAPENTYTYTGKSFTHWKRAIDGSDSNVIYPGPGQDILSGMTSAAVKAADNITLSAQWGNPSMYTVMLNNTDMGGIGGTTEVYTTGGIVFYSDAAGTTAIKGISVPTKQNATYMGHYTTSDVQCIGPSGEFTFATGCEVTSDTRWYARYQCNTGWTDAGTVINEICGKNITVNLNNLYATKKGTEILYARGGSGQVFVDEDYTDMLRAITIPENVPVVSFDANGGTVDLSSFAEDPNIARVAENSLTFLPVAFTGFYSEKSGGTQYIDATGALTEAGRVAIAKSSENLTWYAQWASVATVAPMPTPVRDGYNFRMWTGSFDNDGQSVTVTASPGQRLSVPTSVNLIVYWTPRCNEITLNPTAGTAGSTTTLYKFTDSDDWYLDLKCSAPLQDLSSVIPSRVGYLFRGFYPQSYDKEYIRDIADDYETLIPAVITSDMIIPGWNTTSANVLYASWVKDCEVPDNGTCSVAIGPGGQMVDYTTSCDEGYTLGNADTATPVCTANGYTCSAGQYLNGATCATCMAGSYCTGGTYTYNGEIQGQAACPSGYSNSDAGSDSESDCYRACTTSDVVNATAVSGRVYSDGTNACDATGCVTGYSVKSGLDLNSTIGTVVGDDSTYDSSAMTFGVDYGDLGTITGHAQCSTLGGTTTWEDHVPISDSLPDSSGSYCWCSLDGYTPSGGVTQSLSGPWVFDVDFSDSGVCADDCALNCANLLRSADPYSLVFRAAVFGSVPSTAQCVPNTYTVSYAGNGNTGGSAPTSPTSCTYGSDCTAPANTYTKTGYTFAGWTCTGGGNSCNGNVIAAGGSLKNVSTGTAITLTAKWTINSYTCSAGTYLPKGATVCETCSAGSYCIGGTFTYSTAATQGQAACPSGYSNSDAGSDSESDCYRSCTASDVLNATTVSGRVYSDGRNACDATGCENGYSVQPGDLNTIIGTVDAENVNVNALTFSVDYGDLGSITGRAQCSSQSGTAAWEGDVTISSTLPDSTGRYCYCALDGYTPVGGSVQSLSGPWVLYGDDLVLTLADVCADGCAGLCADALWTGWEFRTALFGSVPSTAQCVPNTYTVSYAGNGNTGGSAPTSPTSCTYDSDCTAPANTYTKTGYTFAGWTCTGGGDSCNGDVIAAGGSLKNVSTGTAITLTAKWTANTYTVSYAANGGSGSAPTSPTSCTYDGTCTAPANTYTKTGYTFAGWTCTGGGDSCNGNVIAAGGSLKNVSTGTAITLTAKWTANTYTVSYAANGGSGSAPTSPKSCTYDGTCTAPANTYTKTGYTFAGWTCTGGGEACNGDVIAAGGSLKNVSTGTAITLTAKWTANVYKVTLDKQSGTGGTAEYYYQYKTKGNCYYYTTSDLTVCTDSSNGGTIAVPTRTGYTFGGYYTGTNGSGTQYVTAAGVTTGSLYSNVAADTTLYAKWTANTYTVSFNANGGTGGQSANVTVTYDAAMPAISTTAPSRTGYTFVGWYDNADYAFGTQYYSETGASARTWNKTANTTLYAGWTKNGYDCKSGEYLNVTSCKVCESGYYCPNGAMTYTYNGEIQGRSPCPSGYADGGTGATTQAQCAMNVPGGKYVANKNASSATDCLCGTYKAAHTVNYGQISSCITTDAGYYAASGASVQTQASLGYYAAAGACEQTKVNAGCYADTAGSSTACPKSCASLGGGLYTKSDAGSDAAEDCYITTTGGYYIANLMDAEETKCEADYYCPAMTLTYPNVGGRELCPDPKVAGNVETVADFAWLSTACPDANVGNTTIKSVAMISYGNTGLSAITQCRVQYTVDTPCAQFVIEGVRYNNEKYATTSGSRHSQKLNAGYYYTQRYSSTYCDGTGNEKRAMLYKAAAKCPANSYCPGGTVPKCNAGTYAETWGATSCTALGSFYTTSVEGATATSACYGETTAGNYISTAGDGEETCIAGSYCPGGIMVNYNSVGGSINCPGGYTAGGTGLKAQSECKISVAGGKYVGTANSSTLSTCVAGTSKAAHTVNYGGTSSCDMCANWTYSGEGAASCTSCPSVTSGWSKTDSTGTGWKSYTSCNQTQKPANCASGAVTKTATSSTQWGTSTVTTALTANANYYVADTTCSACSGLENGFYPNSVAGNSGGSSVCYTDSLSGKYVATPKANGATDCAAGTAKAEHTVNYGETSTCDVCGENQYSDAGASECVLCATPYGYGNTGTTAEEHAGRASCKTVCDAGMYVATAGAACENVGAGYYAPGGEVSYGSISKNRGQCPVQLTTIGYGYGANEADDCGRKLHAGDGVVYLRSAKKNPDELALNVRLNITNDNGASEERVFFGNMTTEEKFMSDGVVKALKINVDDTVYYVHDDSVM